MPIRKCPLCASRIKGRSDKRFCSTRCKSEYHRRLRATNDPITTSIDKILHRNRTILLELMGKRSTKLMVPIIDLEEKKFNFNYITHFKINSEGKTYNYVYEFGWMTFSNNDVMLVRNPRMIIRD